MKKVPSLIDNNRQDLLTVFRDISPQHTHLSIATGYWDMEGMVEVMDSIETYESVRILIGREPLLKRDNKKTITEPEPDYPDDDFYQDLQEIQPTQEARDVVLRMKKMIDEGRLRVRVYRRSFLHAKCYIFGSHESSEAIGIVGSSNFTRNGMSSNTELNAVETDHRIVTYKPKTAEQEVGHLCWFDELWDDEKTEDWTGKFIELVRLSPHGDICYSPKELYLRTLYELYKEEIESENDDIIQPHAHTLFDFQERNVKNLTRMLENQGVAMLADSVGLGKTLSCISVIKQYKNQRVVVVAPASLREHWEKELAREGILHARVISLQNKKEIDDQQKIDKYAPVALFVIDESHNLRSANATRYETLSDWIASEHNEESHVLLATATPINNSLDDLVNQILLAARGEQDIFTVPYKTSEGEVVVRSLYEVVQNIKKRLNQQATQGASEDDIIDIYKESRLLLEPAIQSFVIRNTRESIGTLTYGDGTTVTFPDVSVKTRAYSHIPLTNLTVHDLAFIHQYSTESIGETMDTFLHPLRQVREFEQRGVVHLQEQRSAIYHLYQLILSLSFIPYRWRMYDQRVYGKTRDELRTIRFARREDAESINRQMSLYGIIRTTFLKRLESSAHALEQSLQRYDRRLGLFERILTTQNAIAPIFEIDDILDEYAEDTGEEVLLTDDEIEILLKEKKKVSADGLMREELLQDIASEKALIARLRSYVAELKACDAKFENFKAHLLSVHQDDPSRKVLVFSFYADTITYLKEKIQEDDNCSAIASSAEFVSGATRTNALHAADRFSPKARDYALQPDEQELTYLFTTDVLSEGQNLQDAGLLINYDLHWNPVRMIQRNGRINRIGSRHSQVTVENYIPSDDLEDLLALVERLRRKIELIKHAIGTDSSVLGEDTDPREYIGLYSADERKAKQTYEQLEKDAGAFAEDTFKRDLLNFYQTTSEEECRQVERISYGSWTKLSTLTPPQEVVTLANFTLTENGSESQKPFFFANKRDGSGIDLVPRAIALGALRSDDSIRPYRPFAIDITHHESRTCTFGADLVCYSIGEDASLTPVKQEIHATAREYGWSVEECDNLHATLQTRNIHVRRKIERIVRQISAARKDNDHARAQKLYDALKVHVRAPKKPPEVSSATFAFGFTQS
jgi:superfamily II DNA or RNA helicase